MMRFLFPLIFLVITLIASQSFAFAQQDQPLASGTDKINEIQKDNQWKNFWIKGNYYNSTLDSELQVFKILYKTDGGRVLKIVYNDKTANILVKIESQATGTLHINIPRNLPVTNSGDEQSFPFIIVDGEETQVIEERNQCYRNFAIPFEKGNEEIELIGSLLPTAIQPYGLKVSDECIITPSPRLQIELNGVPFEQIRCDKELELIFKRTDSSPACVKSETKIKLIERGWGMTSLVLTNNIDKQNQLEKNQSRVHARADNGIKYVKINDMAPNSSLIFVYPYTGNETFDNEAFRTWILIRLPIHDGGDKDDISSFRAYSAVDIQLWCLIKYWPQHEWLEDPCHGSLYEPVYGIPFVGPAINYCFKNNALPQLDLGVDNDGYLYVKPPISEIDKNGQVGCGRKLPPDLIEKYREIGESSLKMNQ